MSEIDYVAITGDLVASKKVPATARGEAQKELITVLAELNQELSSALVRPAVLTAGDEVQALFLRASPIIRFVRTLTDGLPSLKAAEQAIVFGIGAGSLSTGRLPEATSVEQLDGTCFHQAREALALAKKNKTWAVFRGFGTEYDQTLTSLFELMGSIRSGWTAKQSQYTIDFRRHDKRIEVARLHGLSPSVITESLQQSHFEAVLRGEKAAYQILHHRFVLKA